LLMTAIASPVSDVTDPPSRMTVFGFEIVPPLPIKTPLELLMICVFVAETNPRSCTRMPSLSPSVVTRLSEITSELRPTEESPGELLLRVVIVMFDAMTRESLSVTRIPLAPVPLVSIIVLETVRLPPPIPPGTSPTRTPVPLVPEVVMCPASRTSVPELSVQAPKRQGLRY
jgi:hypothetical protein